MRKDAAIVERWRQFLRRTVLVGVVIAAHFCLWMTLVGASPWSPHEPQAGPRSREDVLDIRFIRTLPPALRAAPTAAVTRAPAAHRPPQKSASRVRPADHPLAALPAPAPTEPAASVKSTDASALSPPAAPDYVAGGGFQAALQHAQRATSGRLPGALEPRVAGIQLDANSSLKDAARGFTKAVYCSSMQFSMQRAKNPLTPQLMDRLLQLEGCGAHREASAHDAAEAAVMQAALPDQ